jgi:hypothetical protein
MRDQVRDQVANLMRTDARGRRRRLWSALPGVVASVVRWTRRAA